MRRPSCVTVAVVGAIWLSFGSMAYAQESTATPAPITVQKGNAMHASGTFEVKLIPQPPEDKAEGSTLGRMSIDKQFHGDLEGASKGQMLSAMTDVKGSAGYVAIERVTGKLNGRSGSFVLQHNATMTRGAPYLNIVVVPDSGTEELAGLRGAMRIAIDKGNHSYEFEYDLTDGSEER